MSFQNRNLQIDEACSTRRCIAVFVEPIGTCAPFGLMYGACRGGNNQPTHHVTPQAIQKMLNAPPNHLKDPFLGPYTTSHRDFKSPRVPAKIGSPPPRHRPISGKSAPFSLRREHCGPLPRGLTQCDRSSRLPHALKLLEPPSLRGWGES